MRSRRSCNARRRRPRPRSWAPGPSSAASTTSRTPPGSRRCTGSSSMIKQRRRDPGPRHRRAGDYALSAFPKPSTASASASTRIARWRPARHPRRPDPHARRDDRQDHRDDQHPGYQRPHHRGPGRRARRGILGGRQRAAHAERQDQSSERVDRLAGARAQPDAAEAERERRGDLRALPRQIERAQAGGRRVREPLGTTYQDIQSSMVTAIEESAARGAAIAANCNDVLSHLQFQDRVAQRLTSALWISDLWLGTQPSKATPARQSKGCASASSGRLALRRTPPRGSGQPARSRVSRPQRKPAS